jgi:hypothetical protein
MYAADVVLSRIALDAGAVNACDTYLDRLADRDRSGLRWWEVTALIAEASWAFLARDRQQDLARLRQRLPVKTPWQEAVALATVGELGEAADTYARIGALPDEAYARRLAAEALVEIGCDVRAARELEQSLAFWRRVGATAHIRQCEAVLARAASA